MLMIILKNINKNKRKNKNLLKNYHEILHSKKSNNNNNKLKLGNNNKANYQLYLHLENIIKNLLVGYHLNNLKLIWILKKSLMKLLNNLNNLIKNQRKKKRIFHQ